jgi:class 3 adenylate cyclase
MHKKSVQARWIEHAEGRSLTEHAALQRAASEPHVSIVYAKSGSAWFGWLCGLGRPLGRPSAATRSPLAKMKAPAQTHSAAAFKVADADADDDRIPAAILITDIVGSTRLVAEMGDRDFRVLLDRHDDMVRHQIQRFGGIVVGNRGDGFVVVFDTPVHAVCCATEIADGVASLGILLRCGLHFGMVHFKSDKISGIAAHIAARIAATAHPGEALVSKTARDLVIGSAFVFEDRGTHRLRDVPEEIRLYSVRAIAAPKIATRDRHARPSLTPEDHVAAVATVAEPAGPALAHVANPSFAE